MQSDEIYNAQLQALRHDIDKACQQIEHGEHVTFNPSEMLARAKERAKN